LENASGYSHMLIQHLHLGGFMAFQGGIFILLLLAASSFDFIRRQF
jgi:hypothetical protein